MVSVVSVEDAKIGDDPSGRYDREIRDMKRVQYSTVLCERSEISER